MTVRQVQNLLQYLGYYTGAIDGIWGDGSREATRRFQRDHGGLAADGVAGGETQQALRQAVGQGMPEVEKVRDWWEEIEFFRREEFRCTCSGRGCDGFPAEPRERLVRNAEAVRRHFGRVATVSSGVRCRLRNAELPGSAENSLHLSGRAMDLCVAGVKAQALLEYVRTLPEVDEAYAIDGSFVHMGVEKGRG